MFILGCHRSGTSYLSSVITNSLSEINNLTELDTSWVQKNPSNPNGHFESKRLKQTNKTFLNLIGFSWDYPPIYKPKWDTILESFSLEDLRKDFITWIENKTWVDKDPRLSITRELYLHIFLRDVISVYIVRHPFQVINSLYNRDGISYEKGICIWLIYNYHILNSKCSVPKLTVNFNNVEQNYLFYSNSLSNNLKSYLALEEEVANNLNLVLQNKFINLLNKSSIRASYEIVNGESPSKNLINASLKCFEIFNVDPDKFNFKNSAAQYNSYFYEVIEEIIKIFPYPYIPFAIKEDMNDILLPNLNYSSKNITFQKNLKTISSNIEFKIKENIEFQNDQNFKFFEENNKQLSIIIKQLNALNKSLETIKIEVEQKNIRTLESLQQVFVELKQIKQSRSILTKIFRFFRKILKKR